MRRRIKKRRPIHLRLAEQPSFHERASQSRGALDTSRLGHARQLVDRAPARMRNLGPRRVSADPLVDGRRREERRRERAKLHRERLLDLREPSAASVPAEAEHRIKC